MEGDSTFAPLVQIALSFQSTPSAWRETLQSTTECQSIFYFNPLPPHGGRPRRCKISGIFHPISIHSLRMEGDWRAARNDAYCQDFNPLPPHGGRPNSLAALVRTIYISIHSLRMEGDIPLTPYTMSTMEFQSTPSAWRETHRTHAGINTLIAFQSTPSAWRETERTSKMEEKKRISIHSLRMEGDGSIMSNDSKTGHFNPLPPHGGRQETFWQMVQAKEFQSTPSAWRETAHMGRY